MSREVAAQPGATSAALGALDRTAAGGASPSAQREALTFDGVIAACLSRGNRWHRGGITDWTISDWAVAMAGEAGEVCNAVKKLRRIEDEIANINNTDRQLSTREEAIAKIGEELADTFIYLAMLGSRIGVHLPSEIIKKFNATSERYNFPERLP